jgi:hypothetical protein
MNKQSTTMARPGFFQPAALLALFMLGVCWSTEIPFAIR